MFENYLKLVSVVPKLAVGTLIIISIIIVFEIITLLKIQKQAEKERKKEAAPPKPFKFFLVKKGERNISLSSLRSLLVVLIVLLLILVIVTISLLLRSRAKILENGQTAPSATGTLSPTPQDNPDLKIYQFKDDELISISKADLKWLKPGEKIRIMVENSRRFEKAVFFINETPLATDSVLKRTGSGDYYDEYTIPEGVNDFKIVVKLF